jgi:hypothetical protein
MNLIKSIDVIWLYDAVTYMLLIEFIILGFILHPLIGVLVVGMEFMLAYGPVMVRN